MTIQQYIYKETPISPLITFRILFGALMMWGALRFVWNGWIEKLYVEPNFFFKFYGFHWVQPLEATGMYILFGVVIVSALCIALGLFYRIATIAFFLSFTYIELIDATNYLNHYYLVCLFAFLLIFLPANRAFSLDVWRNPTLEVRKVPVWTIHILILQLTIVYTCAGIAKLNSDWLFRAMPLAVWLPEHTDLPIMGYFFQFKETAFLFSWAGAAYDLTIAYFLLFPPTRALAYIAVVVFHGLTYVLFNIGLFPMIMVLSTLVFFSAEFHNRLLGWFGYEHGNTEAQKIFKGNFDNSCKLWQQLEQAEHGDTEAQRVLEAKRRDGETERNVSGNFDNSCKLWQQLEQAEHGDTEAQGILEVERRDGEAERNISGNFDNSCKLWQQLTRTEHGSTKAQRVLEAKRRDGETEKNGNKNFDNSCKLCQQLEWEEHRQAQRKNNNHSNTQTPNYLQTTSNHHQTITTTLLGAYIFLQLLLPFRHFLYDGNVLWTEEGYRFAWRVMLVEKIGQVRFFVEDEETNRKTEIINGRHLTLFQEKQMSIQPDFILQFAHFLAAEYKAKHGMKNPKVTVDAHVALNGRTSQRFINSKVNLAAIEDGFEKKKWILPFDR